MKLKIKRGALSNKSMKRKAAAGKLSLTYINNKNHNFATVFIGSDEDDDDDSDMDSEGEDDGMMAECDEEESVRGDPDDDTMRLRFFSYIFYLIIVFSCQCNNLRIRGHRKVCS